MSDLKCILFIDNEPNVLHGLHRLLRPMEQQWRMTFASTGREALELLGREPFDVVVCDVQMPEMSGIELLREIRRLYPQIVRIVLSSQWDQQRHVQSVGLAHQCLSKPCQVEVLKATVARAFALRALLDSRSLKQVVAQVDALPTLPALYGRLVEELANPDATVPSVAEIIRRDLGMTVKLLRLVNSAYFGVRRHVSNVADALILLGFDTVKAMVLSVRVFEHFDRDHRAGGLDRLFEHALAVGATARQITQMPEFPPGLADDALLAGLLHDAGKLILASRLPDHYATAGELARAQGVPMWQAEQEVFGATHAAVGAYLLGLWGLPDGVVEALAYHHNPLGCLATFPSALTAVCVANILQHQRAEGDEEEPLVGEAQAIAPGCGQYLADLGLLDRLPVWRERCQPAGP